MKDYDKLDYEKTKVKKATRPLQIVVLGSSKAICTKKAYNMAFEVGQELAKAKVLTLTGGGHGVMEAALKGAKKEKGQTLAIVPWEDMSIVNSYADVVIATGIGWSRNSININSADGCIVIHGGAGTLNEATYAYMMSKPTVTLKTSEGIAAEIANKFFDSRKTKMMIGCNTPQEAVKTIIKMAKKNLKNPKKLSQHDKLMIDSEENQNRKVSKK
ncbi:MAG: TIGR00725 family protein [Candidatus Woesearchaeota archaeon]